MQIYDVFFLFWKYFVYKVSVANKKLNKKEKKMKKQIGLFTAILFAVSTLMVSCS